jgi:hypothetical protein
MIFNFFCSLSFFIFVSKKSNCHTCFSRRETVLSEEWFCAVDCFHPKPEFYDSKFTNVTIITFMKLMTFKWFQSNSISSFFIKKIINCWYIRISSVKVYLSRFMIRFLNLLYAYWSTLFLNLIETVERFRLIKWLIEMNSQIKDTILNVLF